MYTRSKKAKTIKNYSLEETIKVLKENNIELLKEIIENQPEIVNEKDQSGNYLLHYATIEDNMEVIGLLLSKGADIEAKNYFSATPLQIATLKVNLNLVKFLIERGARLEVFDTNNNLLFDSSSGEGREMIKYLLDNCISISLPISFVLEDNSSKSSLLFSKDIFSQSAYEKVRKEWEIKQGKAVIQESSSPQMMEIETISEEEREELFDIVEYGDIKLVEKELINIKERGIDINSIRDELDNTLLHIAAEANNLEMSKLLVNNYKANVNAKNKYGLSVLHSVASGIVNKGGKWDIMEWILQEKNLDINVKTKGDLTVLNMFLAKDEHLADRYEDLLEKFFQEKKIEQEPKF